MVTSLDQDTELDSDGLIAEPETSPPRTRDERGRLLPGVSGNPSGRPKRGQTAQDKLVTAVNRAADQIVSGQIGAASRGNTRAFIALWDRAFGVPKQTLQIIRDDDPALAWLASMTGVPIASDSPVPQLPAPQVDNPTE